MKKLILFFFLFTTLFVNAQEPQMADGMRAEGKIYVVITVLAVIFGCVVAYLVMIDRKVKKLEEELKNKK
ncbi:MAG: CcmD family protein [Bacteroidia bacterium]|nr:CcmD family protein [Bacteroidia bacterium]